jgi:hypothetical protein
MKILVIAFCLLITNFSATISACDICVKDFIIDDMAEARYILKLIEEYEYSGQQLGSKEFYYYTEGRLEACEDILKEFDKPCEITCD